MDRRTEGRMDRWYTQDSTIHHPERSVQREIIDLKKHSNGTLVSRHTVMEWNGCKHHRKTWLMSRARCKFDLFAITRIGCSAWVSFRSSDRFPSAFGRWRLWREGSCERVGRVNGATGRTSGLSVGVVTERGTWKSSLEATLTDLLAERANVDEENSLEVVE